VATAERVRLAVANAGMEPIAEEPISVSQGIVMVGPGATPSAAPGKIHGQALSPVMVHKAILRALSRCCPSFYQPPSTQAVCLA